jgi:hypothetical protein
MVNLYIGNTDNDWFDFLAAQRSEPMQRRQERVGTALPRAQCRPAHIDRASAHPTAVWQVNTQARLQIG